MTYSSPLSRRFLLRPSVAAAVFPLGLGSGTGRAWGPGSAAFVPGPIYLTAATGDATVPLKPIKLAWNALAISTAAAPVAKETGIFARHGLDVEFVNFGGSTEALL